MSEGFPELFNHRGQMLGYEKAVKLFEQLAHKSSEDIVFGLKNAESSRVKDKYSDDNVTFVLIIVI